jgi:hypothetical protein
MTTPVYVRRFARVTRAIEVLSHYPDGRRLADLAAELGATESVLREEILAYYAADPTVDQLGGGDREPVIEFVADPGLVDSDEDDVDPADARYVRLRDMRPAAEVGTHLPVPGPARAGVEGGPRPAHPRPGQHRARRSRRGAGDDDPGRPGPPIGTAGWPQPPSRSAAPPANGAGCASATRAPGHRASSSTSSSLSDAIFQATYGKSA